MDLSSRWSSSGLIYERPDKQRHTAEFMQDLSPDKVIPSNSWNKQNRSHEWGTEQVLVLARRFLTACHRSLLLMPRLANGASNPLSECVYTAVRSQYPRNALRVDRRSSSPPVNTTVVRCERDRDFRKLPSEVIATESPLRVIVLRGCQTDKDQFNKLSRTILSIQTSFPSEDPLA